MISMIYAYNPLAGNLNFGKEDGLPWGYIKEDLENFKRITLNSTIVMGAKTFQSLPCKLPNRKHIVLASRYGTISAKNGDLPDEVIKMDINLKNIAELDIGGDLFFIGGAELLNIVKHIADKVYITVVHGHYPADVTLDSSLAYNSEFMSKFKSKSKMGDSVIFYELS